MNKKLHITSVCWYKVYPPETGGQNGIVYFNEALLKQFSLTVICSKDNIITEGYKGIVQPVLPVSKTQFLRWGSYRKILDSICKHQSQYVLIEHPYYFLLYLWRHKYKFQLIVHNHNIEYKRARKNGKWFWPLVYWCEKKAYKKANVVIVKTKEDRAFLQTKFAIPKEKIYVLPYGIAAKDAPFDKEAARREICNRYGIPAGTKILLFAASFDYTPNQQALQHLVKDIYPNLAGLANFKIVLCGRYQEGCIKKLNLQLPDEFICAGYVEDIRQYFMAADLLVNPVYTGEGIQTKNIDAIASNCTVIGYDAVANGVPEYLVNEKCFFVPAGNAQLFAKQIITCLEGRFVFTNSRFFADFNWENRVQSIFGQILTLSS